jgi:hypothetical protein
VSRTRRGVAALRPLLVAALLAPLTACSSPASQPPEPPVVRLSVPPGGCPAALGAARDVVGASSDPTTLLHEPSRVTGALVCEYASAIGPSGTRGRLRREVDLPQQDARRLAAALHDVRIVRSTGPAACPADRGTADVLAFRRAAPAADTDVWWWTSGCQTLDDGAERTGQLGNPSFGRFQQAFAQLVPAPH